MSNTIHEKLADIKSTNPELHEHVSRLIGLVKGSVFEADLVEVIVALSKTVEPAVIEDPDTIERLIREGVVLGEETVCPKCFARPKAYMHYKASMCDECSRKSRPRKGVKSNVSMEGNGG